MNLHEKVQKDIEGKKNQINKLRRDSAHFQKWLADNPHHPLLNLELPPNHYFWEHSSSTREEPVFYLYLVLTATESYRYSQFMDTLGIDGIPWTVIGNTKHFQTKVQGVIVDLERHVAPCVKAVVRTTMEWCGDTPDDVEVLYYVKENN